MINTQHEHLTLNAQHTIHQVIARGAGKKKAVAFAESLSEWDTSQQETPNLKPYIALQPLPPVASAQRSESRVLGFRV